MVASCQLDWVHGLHSAGHLGLFLTCSTFHALSSTWPLFGPSLALRSCSYCVCQCCSFACAIPSFWLFLSSFSPALQEVSFAVLTCSSLGPLHLMPVPVPSPSLTLFVGTGPVVPFWGALPPRGRPVFLGESWRIGCLWSSFCLFMDVCFLTWTSRSISDMEMLLQF